MLNRALFIFLVLIISACASDPTTQYVERESFDVTATAGAGRKLVLWMLSDIQPSNKGERIYFERAIGDINRNVEQVDIGIMAGDLLKSGSKAEAFDWFLDTRKMSKVSYWYEIAGNHDIRNKTLFRKYFHRPSYYGVTAGNVLLLHLSDESRDSKTEISDAAFRWWQDMVVHNQDRIIITVTHGQLHHSGLLGSSLLSRRIADSARFEEVLKEYRVAVWASGHSHLPQGLSGTVNVNRELGGTCFVNVSSIGEAPLMDSQSRFFFFEDGSDTLWLRSRNHSKQKFDTGLDIALKLEKSFSRDGVEPRIVLKPGAVE